MLARKLLQPLRRTLYKKSGPIPQLWTKNNVDLKVHEILFDYSNTEDEEVTLNANLDTKLLIDSTEKFGFYLDLCEEFQLMIPAYRNSVRNWQSGKEAADWIAYNLEEQGRLVDYE